MNGIRDDHVVEEIVDELLIQLAVSGGVRTG
jgi:hypothetical protein